MSCFAHCLQLPAGTSSSIAVVAWLTMLHKMLQVNPSMLKLVSLVGIYKAEQCITLLNGVGLKGHLRPCNGYMLESCSSAGPMHDDICAHSCRHVWTRQTQLASLAAGPGHAIALQPLAEAAY